MPNKIDEEFSEHSTPEVITVGDSSFVKNHDGSLIKLGAQDDYDDSNLIYR